MEIVWIGSIRAPVSGLLKHFLGFGCHPRLALSHPTPGGSGTHRTGFQMSGAQEETLSETVMVVLFTHMLLMLSGWLLGRPLTPWPSVPPPSEGGSMR